MRLQPRQLAGCSVPGEHRHGAAPVDGHIELLAVGAERQVGGGKQIGDAAHVVLDHFDERERTRCRIPAEHGDGMVQTPGRVDVTPVGADDDGGGIVEPVHAVRAVVFDFNELEPSRFRIPKEDGKVVLQVTDGIERCSVGADGYVADAVESVGVVFVLQGLKLGQVTGRIRVIKRTSLPESVGGHFCHGIGAGCQTGELVGSFFVNAGSSRIVVCGFDGRLAVVELAVFVEIEVDRHTGQPRFAGIPDAVGIQVVPLGAVDFADGIVVGHIERVTGLRNERLPHVKTGHVETDNSDEFAVVLQSSASDRLVAG